MTSNAIEYFATLGKRPGSLSVKKTDPNYSPTEIWNNAITDIAVVNEGLFETKFFISM